MISKNLWLREVKIKANICDSSPYSLILCELGLGKYHLFELNYCLGLESSGWSLKSNPLSLIQASRDVLKEYVSQKVDGLELESLVNDKEVKLIEGLSSFDC